MSDETDRKINAALQENEESIKDIIRSAYASFSERDERDMTLVSSGFALGWASLEAEQEDGTPREYNVTDSVRLVASTLSKLDDLILSGTVDAQVVEALRNPLARFITGHKEARKKAILGFLQAQYGMFAGSLLAESRALTDEEAMEVGISAASTGRGPLFGFVMFSGDLSKVRCQCPVHLEAGLVEHQISAQVAHDTLRQKYGSTYNALIAFGRWLAIYINARLAMHGEYADLDPGTLDTDEAGKLSNGLFSRLMFHGKEGGDS